MQKKKKKILSSSNLAFLIEDYAFLVEVWSKTGQGMAQDWSRPNGHLPCIYFPMASQPVEAIFLAFWFSMLETYKLRAPLHL